MPTRKLIGALAALFVALSALAFVLRPKASPLGQAAAPTATVCAACGHAEARSLAAVPDACTACGKRQVYPALPCPKCRTATPIRAHGGPQQRAVGLVCPRCGTRFAPGQNATRPPARPNPTL